jgi:hypothetical protein
VRWFVACAVVTSIAAGCASTASRRSVDDQPSTIYVSTVLASDAPRVALVERFFAAFNEGDRVGVLALMSDEPGVSDCDYATASVIDLRGRDQVSAWLEARISEHDRLTVSSISNSNPDPSSAAIGVSFRRRTSDTLRRLGLVDGLTPQAGAKIRFTGSGAELRIEEFANGPVGGPSELCKPT